MRGYSPRKILSIAPAFVKPMDPIIKVHDMSQWSDLWATRDKDALTDVITHHTVMAPNAGPAAIDAAELSQGSYGAGYNFYITGAGVIWILRPVHNLPAAAYGRNRQSINVALGGDFTDALPTKAQYDSWCWLVSRLVNAQVPYAPGEISQEKYVIKNLMGHREVATRFYASDTADYSTACPGDKFFPVFRQQWVHQIRELTHKDVK